MIRFFGSCFYFFHLWTPGDIPSLRCPLSTSFLALWHLTYDLDLSTWPDLHAPIQVCMTVCSTGIASRTDRQTHTHDVKTIAPDTSSILCMKYLYNAKMAFGEDLLYFWQKLYGNSIQHALKCGKSKKFQTIPTNEKAKASISAHQVTFFFQ